MGDHRLWIFGYPFSQIDIPTNIQQINKFSCIVTNQLPTKLCFNKPAKL